MSGKASSSHGSSCDTESLTHTARVACLAKHSMDATTQMRPTNCCGLAARSARVLQPLPRPSARSRTSLRACGRVAIAHTCGELRSGQLGEAQQQAPIALLQSNFHIQRASTLSPPLAQRQNSESRLCVSATLLVFDTTRQMVLRIESVLRPRYQRRWFSDTSCFKPIACNNFVACVLDLHISAFALQP